MSQRWQILGSALSAFIIGAGGSTGVGLLAGGGVLNRGAVIGIVATGALAAAKDYRSLMKLPPVKDSGDTASITKPQ